MLPKIKTIDFDRIATSQPINATAAMATAEATTERDEIKFPPGFLHWRERPLTRAFVVNPQDSTLRDFTGTKFGRFTVVGLLAESGAGQWVCRCTCGDYEVRRSKAIKAAVAGLVPEGVATMCYVCAKWQTANSRYKKKGSAALSKFTEPQAETKKKSPQEVIAETLGQLTDAPMVKAEGIIAHLNRAGYRITKDKPQGGHG